MWETTCVCHLIVTAEQMKQDLVMLIPGIRNLFWRDTVHYAWIGIVSSVATE